MTERWGIKFLKLWSLIKKSILKNVLDPDGCSDFDTGVSDTGDFDTEEGFVIITQKINDFVTLLEISMHFLIISFLCLNLDVYSVDFVLVDFNILKIHLICINLHKLS